MKRAEKTKLLSRLLESKLICDQVYWAREVSLDFNTSHRKRVDYMSFKPKNQSSSGIEKGIFTCYEVKSCFEDYKSGHGLNFIGEKNYIVTDMVTYKKILYDIDHNTGVYVALPVGADKFEEWDSPKELDSNTQYELNCINSCHETNRDYSMNVLLFCMLRSGH
ncbi:MAG: hypothetical protein R3Y63_08875 [Eubacteriales bacterium]